MFCLTKEIVEKGGEECVCAHARAPEKLLGSGEDDDDDDAAAAAAAAANDDDDDEGSSGTLITFHQKGGSLLSAVAWKERMRVGECVAVCLLLSAL